jgi:hypothetical protein
MYIEGNIGPYRYFCIDLSVFPVENRRPWVIKVDFQICQGSGISATSHVVDPGPNILHIIDGLWLSLA